MQEVGVLVASYQIKGFDAVMHFEVIRCTLWKSGRAGWVVEECEGKNVDGVVKNVDGLGGVVEER